MAPGEAASRGYDPLLDLSCVFLSDLVYVYLLGLKSRHQILLVGEVIGADLCIVESYKRLPVHAAIIHLNSLDWNVPSK